jgi:hypothetical protein
MSVNEFVPFAAQPGAVVTPQSAYAGARSTQLGYSPGPVQPADINKALRQATFVSAALAQVIVNTLGQSVLDNGDLAGLVSQLTLVLAGSGSSLRTASDTFSSGAGPFPLSFQPDGKLLLVFFDGIEQPTDNWSLQGQQIVLDPSVDHTLFSTVRAAYTYLSSASLRVHNDSFAVSVPGPYTLSQQPNNSMLLVFFDGIEQPSANVVISGRSLSIAPGVDQTTFQTVRLSYAF